MGEDIDVLYNFIHSGPPDHRAWCNEHVRDKEMRKALIVSPAITTLSGRGVII